MSEIIISLPEMPDVTDNDPRIELKKILYQAQLDLIEAERQAELDRETARAAVEQQAALDRQKTAIADDFARETALWENEYSLAQAIHNAYIEITKGQIDRNMDKADFVQKAAAAIGSAYTAILALSFAVGNESTILPARGIAPTIFLGLSIALAVGYVSYLPNPDRVRDQLSDGTITGEQRARLYTFILWIKSVARSYPYFLHAAVISLGVGVIFLPAPYIGIRSFFVVIAVIAGLLLTFLFPLYTSRPKDRSQ